MRLSHPATRSMLLAVTFLVIFLQILLSWVLARFVHAEAQFRTLMPEYYDVQVVTAEDYGRLADRSVPKVTLADGTTVEKAAAWYDVVLPGYKPTADGKHYVLVTTYGTGHVLSYLEPTLLLMGTLTLCGLGFGIWNVSLMRKESAPESEGNSAPDAVAVA